jgi:acyl phosphate:glycerol-3-phosphate acyltransferase
VVGHGKLTCPVPAPAPALTLVLIALGFCAGSIPFGVIIARRVGGVDIQQHGSGNIGATNVARVLGRAAGALVLVLDAAKGALPVALALHLAADPRVALAAGGAAILGHCFSPFLRFRGGKGVATALGVFLVLSPPAALVGVVAFAAVYALTRVAALGSLAGAVAIAVAISARDDRPTSAFAIATCALLFFTHRSNLARLRR